MLSTGILLGVCIGVILGILAAILIYAVFTKAFDVKVVVSAVSPIAAVLIAQQWLKDLFSSMPIDDVVLGAVSAFLIVILYPAVILMFRFGRDVGQASLRQPKSR